MHFDRFGCLWAPVLGLLIYLGIYVELGQEGLHVILILDGHKADFKILGEIYLLLVSLAWMSSISFLGEEELEVEVLVLLPCYSVLWKTH